MHYDPLEVKNTCLSVCCIKKVLDIDQDNVYTLYVGCTWQPSSIRYYYRTIHS